MAAAEEPQQQDAQAFEPVATPVEVREPVPTAAEPELVKEDQEQPGLDANAVDEKLTQAASPKATESVNGGLDEPHSQSAEAIKLDPSNGSQDTAVPVENVAEPDKSQESSPAAVAKPKQEAAPEPVLPPKPMTWASRAAAAAGPRPVVPLPKTATSPAQSQNRAAAANSVAGGPAAAAAGPSPAVASSSAPTASPTIAPSAAATSVPPTAASQNAAPAATSAPAPDTPVKESSGWQTAGGDSKRQNRPQSMSAPHATEKEGTLVYVRFVTSKVQEADLRSVLAAYGELVYFDINRQKVCYVC